IITQMIIIFFFQAEDGIRDSSVTGVQTCALPISNARAHRAERAARPLLCPGERCGRARGSARARAIRGSAAIHPHRAETERCRRSEERRVGKECRSRVWRGQSKKKHNIIEW